MKQFGIVSTFLCISMCLSAQKNAKIYESYVKFQSASSPGVVTVLSSGFGKKKNESTSNAVEHAFITLLFSGIPGSQFELPMLKSRGDSLTEAFISQLQKNGYSNYIVENKLISDEDVTKKEDGTKGKMTVCSITINCDALRRYLEQYGLIRKFGI